MLQQFANRKGTEFQLCLLRKHKSISRHRKAKTTDNALTSPACGESCKDEAEHAKGQIARIQLFRQRLSHKSVKAYATKPIGIMGRKSSASID